MILSDSYIWHEKMISQTTHFKRYQFLKRYLKEILYGPYLLLHTQWVPGCEVLLEKPAGNLWSLPACESNEIVEVF